MEWTLQFTTDLENNIGVAIQQMHISSMYIYAKQDAFLKCTYIVGNIYCKIYIPLRIQIHTQIQTGRARRLTTLLNLNQHKQLNLKHVIWHNSYANFTCYQRCMDSVKYR